MDRLSKEQWLDHGLTNLANDGFSALKADKLAKSLGVSRGSFYWHFKNLADFHQSVLARWQELSFSRTVQQLEQQDLDARGRLKVLIGIAADNNVNLDRAIRAWALQDDGVKEAVLNLDILCLGYLEQLLGELGIDPVKAKVRARIIYGAYLGETMLGVELSEEERVLIIDELVEIVVY